VNVTSSLKSYARRVVVACMGAAALSTACSATAGAQILAQATPVRMNLTAKAGEPLHRDLQISNLGDQPISVRVQLSDWLLTEDGALSLAPAGSTAASLDGFVRFDPSEFTLAPNQSKSIDVTLALPATGPATRWGMLMSEVRPAAGATGAAASALGTDLGTTIYLSRIPADQVHVEEYSLTVAQIGGDSLLVTAGISNDGDRHATISGSFALVDTSGVTLEAATVGSGVVLPGAYRNFSWICTAPVQAGRYRIVGSFDDGAEHALRREAEFSVAARSAGPVASSDSH
jgi:P pilus assembly chaperone PapD